MSKKPQHDAGLSLIEVLVSLAIFAIIGMAGLAILNTVARTGERTEGRLERLAEVDRAFLVIRRDLAQMIGADVSLDENSFAFRRARGHSSTKMAFQVNDAVLIRQIDTPPAAPVSQMLLTGISSARWRLLDGKRRWHTNWPPAGMDAPGRPLAAELTLEIWRQEVANPQQVSRLMTLPAGLGR